ncbi:MAG: hypothetical protein CML56_04660 [Rhodobacteraceae bacterium]|nr:hypothetical protein [Paracoccaceae bacterium]|tara:strand:- start:210 stop:434 length:225 start_codon:yes stop_codon:yes gene_type:complete
MKKGDMVMFMDDKDVNYSKWFFGQIGELEKDPRRGDDGKMHVAVKWLRPVKYFSKYSSKSHFSADKFRVICGNR